MKKDIILFRLSYFMLFISSFSILLSFLGDYNGNLFNLIFAIATGVLFWGGLVLGYVFLMLVNSSRKKYEAKNHINVRAKKRAGAFTFFSNKPAKVFDLSMIFFLILTVIFLCIPLFNQAIALIFLALFVFSLHMHCILNGINFIYIKNIRSKESKK